MAVPEVKSKTPLSDFKQITEANPPAVTERTALRVFSNPQVGSAGIIPRAMSNSNKKSEPILAFKTAQELEAYLADEPRTSKGFWLKLSKSGAVEATITKGDAIEVALCWGWIDGQLDKFDDQHFLVRMTPRRPRSRWSAKNREAADRLLMQGRLRSPGLAEVEAAKSDGRWEAAYASQGKAEVPEDLAAALASRASAKRFFEALDRANRYSIIYRVNGAKRTETRARRIAQFVEMLARGETIHPRTAAPRAPRRPKG
ncbi:MAG TPA: YdeI/OmpD-associated family protein [Stellaceae bacterium]|nr:YdeI/OmpD-associated family protein [Stellaceae bacterium]